MIFAVISYYLSSSFLTTSAVVVITAKIIYAEINIRLVCMVIVDLASVTVSSVCHYLYPLLIVRPSVIIVNKLASILASFSISHCHCSN